MRALPGGMDARIRASGSVNDDASAAKRAERALDGILDGLPVRLTLPSGKPASVVSEREPQPHACESSQLWSRICAAT